MINVLYLFNFLQCGHFCIRYILKQERIKPNVVYYKRLMSLGLIRRVLKEYYENVECYFVEDFNDLLSESHFIALVKLRNKLNHYVVIECVKENYIYYYDPMFLGIKKKRVDSFIKMWGKYCCFFNKK